MLVRPLRFQKAMQSRKVVAGNVRVEVVLQVVMPSSARVRVEDKPWSEGQAYRWFYIKQSAERAGWHPGKGEDSDTIAGYTKSAHAKRKGNVGDSAKTKGGGAIAKYAAGAESSKYRRRCG